MLEASKKPRKPNEAVVEFLDPMEMATIRHEIVRNLARLMEGDFPRVVRGFRALGELPPATPAEATRKLRLLQQQTYTQMKRCMFFGPNPLQNLTPEKRLAAIAKKVVLTNEREIANGIPQKGRIHLSIARELSVVPGSELLQPAGFNILQYLVLQGGLSQSFDTIRRLNGGREETCRAALDTLEILLSERDNHPLICRKEEDEKQEVSRWAAWRRDAARRRPARDIWA